MKIRITVLALVIGGALLVRVETHKTPGVVHAQTGCDVTSLSGAFGYTLSGFYFDNAGNTNFFNGVGLLNADGQGNLTSTESDSFSGQIAQSDALTGSYTVNANCTGSLTTISQSNGTANYDFVLTNGRGSLQLVETDNGTNITGTGTRQ